jgi:hypothetical protein
MAANAHVFRGPTILGMSDEAEVRVLAKVVLTWVDARGAEISALQRERIASGADAELIEAWFARAIDIIEVDDMHDYLPED